MIRFLFKGILRDKNRSVLPIIIISIGVFITVAISGYLRGVMGDMIDQNARLETGHVKVMTHAYAENQDQLPNDLAIIGLTELKSNLENDHPQMNWSPRIRFGGLIDVPDENGLTKMQGNTGGMAVDLLSGDKQEIERLQLENSIVQGRLPKAPTEMLMGYALAEKLGVKPGDEVTYFGSTVNGSLTFKNFVVVATIRFGASFMDKAMVMVDLTDAQEMLDMQDGAGELLGYLNTGVYDDDIVSEIAVDYNSKFDYKQDEFAPEMFPLSKQNNLDGYLDYVDMFSALFVGIFVFAMSIVLWNTGLIGGLRRYQEYGIRLALGESKGHIYRSMALEAVIIGCIGSITGTVLGLAVVLYMQNVGIDISEMLPESTVLMPSTLRAKFTTELLIIGFIPGLFAMLVGNLLSGIGIYKRETASLFKELEV